MLYYVRIDIIEGIDLTKRSNSKECMIFHYWFFNHGFKFQDSVCNGCHDLSKMIYYRCIIHNISKYEAINLLKSAVLEDREYI